MLMRKKRLFSLKIGNHAPRGVGKVDGKEEKWAIWERWGKNNIFGRNFPHTHRNERDVMRKSGRKSCGTDAENSPGNPDGDNKLENSPSEDLLLEKIA
ncbi:unnamed protein product [Allacma fusca]|uniref:Uncharacterized protein n=1 Tax=Allacma fusca TaxID=39272 RepID=A0A8J2KGV2_9HEXA|nr:unnamed protein product [Allacma fusca]